YVNWGNTSATAPAISSIVDSAGDTYTLAAQKFSSQNAAVAIYYATAQSASVPTVTVRWAAAATGPEIGCTNSETLDQSTKYRPPAARHKTSPAAASRQQTLTIFCLA